jgi:hypothetical protein
LHERGEHDQEQAQQRGAGAKGPADLRDQEAEKTQRDDEGEEEQVFVALGPEKEQRGADDQGDDVPVDVVKKGLPAEGLGGGEERKALGDGLGDFRDKRIADDEDVDAAEHDGERGGRNRDERGEPAPQRTRRCVGCGETAFGEEGDEFGAAPPRERVERVVDLETQAEVGGRVFEKVEREGGRRTDATPEPPEVGLEGGAVALGGAAEGPRGDQTGEAGEGDGGNRRGGAEPQADGTGDRGENRGAAGGFARRREQRRLVGNGGPPPASAHEDRAEGEAEGGGGEEPVVIDVTRSEAAVEGFGAHDAESDKGAGAGAGVAADERGKPDDDDEQQREIEPRNDALGGEGERFTGELMADTARLGDEMGEGGIPMHGAAGRGVVVVGVAHAPRGAFVEGEGVAHPRLGVGVVRRDDVPVWRRDRRNARGGVVEQRDIVAHGERVPCDEQRRQRPRAEHDEPPRAAAFPG